MAETTNVKLARRLGFGTLLLIGIGDILGAGIYALVGKVAGMAGSAAWLSFLIAALLAAVTGLAYAELACRIPKSAGAAAYTAAAFAHPLIPFLVGFLVLASGLTSTATVALAFRGYLESFVGVPEIAAALGLVAVLSGIALRGISASAWTTNVLTVLEAGGLFLVIGTGAVFAFRTEPATLLAKLKPDLAVPPIIGAATLAFYAFIGFEDLANLAEEAKNPERDLPRAILIAVAITTMIYLAVIIVVLWTLGADQAAASSRPLLDALTAAGTPLPARAFSLLAIFAITNTGLANFIMVSRLLYGMAGQGLLPLALRRVHPVRQTPWVAILIASALAFLLAATGGARLLAQTTSLLLVLVFTVLHTSLIRIKQKEGAFRPSFRAPAFVPWLGLFISAVLLWHFPPGAFVRAGVVVFVGIGVYFLFKKHPS